MDKNMIHIDELVKQRLGGGEEREMPGSWVRMRELLDKEMPEKKRLAGYYNWRRMFGALTGLVLLSVLTVGGYNLVNSYRLNTNNGNKAITVANTNAKISDGSKEQTKIQYHNTASGKTPEVSMIPANGTRTKGQKTFSYTANKSVNRRPGQSGNEGIVSGSSRKNLTAVSSPGKISTDIITQEDKANNATVKPTPLQISESTGKEGNIAVASPKGRKTSITEPPLSKDKNDNKVVSALLEKRAIDNDQYPVQPSDNFNTAVTTDNTRLKVAPAPIQPDLQKDTLNKMQIIQRMTINPLTQMSSIILDTVSIEQLIFNRAVDANVVAIVPDAPTSGVNSVTNAGNIEIDASETLVPLANFKIQSRKTSKWNARSFDEVVRDVKFNLAQTKFYPGISAGGNSYMFGANNLSGFQLGLFGLFTFGETWGAMGELKYIQRFNSGATLNDNYIDVVQKQGGYLQGNVEHFFKFTSLQSIEMPLALRYAAGRLNLFGGLNLAYHFAINVDEQTLTAPDTAYKPFNNPGGKIKVRPAVAYDDFRARFALGGLLGISYELFPSLQLDFRATKSIWDNAYGLGAEQVSSQLYNAPSIQFSIFYRFSQRNQIPRAK